LPTIQIAKLEEGCERFKYCQRWTRTAVYVGNDVTEAQCKMRWNRMHGATVEIGRQPWTPDEVCLFIVKQFSFDIFLALNSTRNVCSLIYKQLDIVLSISVTF
jgi:hypothetical protein